MTDSFFKRYKNFFFGTLCDIFGHGVPGDCHPGTRKWHSASKKSSVGIFYGAGKKIVFVSLKGRCPLFKLVFLSLAILCCSCSYSVKNLDSKGESIICFGDSITYGVGAKRGEDFPSILSNLLGKDVINAGVNGDSTQSALRRLKKDVLAKSAYLVIVELGGNDFLHKVPKQKTIKNLREIIVRIQETGAMVGLADVSAGMFLSGYRSDFKRLAKETGCIFIPCILEGIINNPSLKADYIHPNAKGYRIIAERIYTTIKPYIK